MCFGWFKKKKRASKQAKQAQNEYFDLLRANKYDEVIAKITAAHGEDDMPAKTRQSLGLAYYYKQDYVNSLRHFEILAAETENLENLFNVLISSVELKKFEQAKQVFDKMLAIHNNAKNGEPEGDFLPQLCVPYIRYYYACGLADAEQYADALVQVEELKKVFLSLRITDGTFLYIRGVPFFDSTLELAQKVYDGLSMDFQNSDFIKELSSGVDDEGQALIKERFLSHGAASVG